jgi:hypothetical protein
MYSMFLWGYFQACLGSLLLKKSLDAVKRAGGSAEVVDYLHSKCEHKSKPQYHPNTSKTVLMCDQRL